MDGLLQRQLSRMYRHYNAFQAAFAPGRHANHVNQVQSERINCEDDILSYAPDEKTLPGVYICNKSLHPDLNEYFEVEVLDCGLCGDIAVGLVQTNHPLDQLPGFVAGSVGYHAGDGRIYLGHQRGTIVASKCEVGDRLGCGVRFENLPSQRQLHGKPSIMLPFVKMRVYFTLNGIEVSGFILKISLF